MRFFQQKRHPRWSSYLAITVIFAAMLTLSACGDSDNDDDNGNGGDNGGGGGDNTVSTTYDVKVYNLTNNQLFTPLAIVVHGSAYMPWQLGEMVTVGLEMLAESGSTTDFLSKATANNAVVMTTSSNGPVDPGSSEMVSVTVDHSAGLQITVATMLANTNDAFTGIRNWNIGELAVGDSVSRMARVYDSGTEANSETAASMPGPVSMGTGEGFHAARETLDRLTVHGGVVTKDDGLTTSALDESHRWLGNAAKVVVTRMQ